MRESTPEIAGSRRLLAGTVVSAASARLSVVDDQRARFARRTSQYALNGAAGLTLVELLVTMVVLGVISAVVVFGVSGLRAKSQGAACASDRAALEHALEAYRAQYGTYGSEAQLVATGQLRQESSLWDVDLTGDGDYTLTARAECADDGAGEAAGAPAAAVTPESAAPPGTVATTTTEPPTTTTTAPATTTTTTPSPLHLASVCTPRSHWPGERAWQIANPNSAAIPFVLDATNAGSHTRHRIDDAARAGTSTWYLPAPGRGRTNRAILSAANTLVAVNGSNRVC